MLYLVQYTGPFAYIKPWTAVRDAETFSQQFLTPSIVEGLEKKLFPELLDKEQFPPGNCYKILRHRLSYAGLSPQQERTWSKGWVTKTVDKKKYRQKERSIITRSILLEPQLLLAFETETDAELATEQSICLCRNEDLLFPEPEILRCTEAEFETEEFPGFELVFTGNSAGFKVGHNRFAAGEPMFGELRVFGNPIREPQNW
jgi:hypothetical protein